MKIEQLFLGLITHYISTSIFIGLKYEAKRASTEIGK